MKKILIFLQLLFMATNIIAQDSASGTNFGEDNSKIVGIWKSPQNKYVIFREDNTTNLEGYDNYSFLPFQGKILLSTNNEVNDYYEVFDLTENQLVMRHAGSSPLVVFTRTDCIPNIGKYYIVGNLNGWNPTNCIQNMFICIGNNQYTYTTKWNGSYDLKFWPAGSIGDWNNSIWGAGNGDGSESGKLICGSDARIFQAPSADYYTLTINMSNATYFWTKVDAPTKEFSEYGIIGDFNNWGTNVDMVKLTKAPHNWYLRYTFTSDTQFKFRGENNQDYIWGANNDVTIDADKYWDTPKAGGQAIGIKAGTYDIYFNDITGQWGCVKVE